MGKSGNPKRLSVRSRGQGVGCFMEGLVRVKGVALVPVSSTQRAVVCMCFAFPGMKL